MSRWTRAYRGLTLNHPTPARIALFNMATRNLARQLGIPEQQILERVSAAAKGDSNARNAEEPTK